MSNDSFSQQQQQQSSAMSGESGGMTQSQTGDVSANGSHAYLAGYTPPTDCFDEYVDETGKIRPHWKEIDQWLHEAGTDGLNRRLKQIRQMVHQHGIAFSSYGEASVREKHLQLDALPVLIPGEQWLEIESGLQQRATLLNMLLGDLYGPQTLLKNGTLPPEVLFRHPSHRLPFHQLPPAGHRHLHFYAAELARSPSGEWWVMTDRTDAPGGSGFALENRVVISRALSLEFRRSNVQRLAPYFIALREHLASLAPQQKENPHIAILSAGTGSASYFEDAYLARYLGFTLVEAGDLVVRRNRVMLKTLSGLLPIDVIMRRQHSNHLDPLELGGSAPGIAGILQVAREGNVTIVSAPGSGLVESPIFMAFMPRVCQSLMGTDLDLPGVATWWGGESKSLERILDCIDDIALLPAFRHRTAFGIATTNTIYAAAMSRAERIAAVSSNPNLWVGQERIHRSSAAVWDEGKFVAKHLSLRTFAVASSESYQVMPGGLTRIAESSNELAFNAFQGGGTKDAWVLADKPVEQVSLLRSSGDALHFVRGSGYISSRLADNFCWLGRNLERADARARLLRAVIVRLTSEADPADLHELPMLIRALAAEGLIDPGFAIDDIRSSLPDFERTLSACTLDRSDHGSLRSLLDQVFLLASKVRERLSPDVWRVVQKVSESFETTDPDKGCDLAELLDITNELIVGLAAFSGLVNESMTRTHSSSFLNLGRRLERSLQIVSLVKNCFIPDHNVSSELLEAVLEVADSIMTYRSRYYANLQMSAVLDLLLVDETNPRSLAFQLDSLNRNVDSLPGNNDQTYFSKEQRLVMDALHTVRMAEIDELCELHALGEPQRLFALLRHVEEQLPLIATSVSNRFLVHSGAMSQLVGETPTGKR